MSTFNGILLKSPAEWTVIKNGLRYAIVKEETTTLNPNDEYSNVCCELLKPATPIVNGLVSLISIMP